MQSLHELPFALDARSTAGAWSLEAVRVAAVELGPDHVRVNAINADQIETPLFQRFVESMRKAKSASKASA